MAEMGNKLKVKAIHAGYLPLRDNAREYLVLHDQDRRNKLEKIIHFIFKAMSKGYFFTTGNCHWCHYENICGKGVVLVSSRRMENALKDDQVKELVQEYKSFEEL